MERSSDNQPAGAAPVASIDVPAISAGDYARLWFSIGLRSFGGGAATLYMIHQAFVEERRWITDDVFTRMWSLCQLAPGINLLALTILIGRRLLGVAGIVLGLLGLLLPSVAITLLITASYASVQHSQIARAALRGVVPATVGLGLMTAWNMARPPLTASRLEGRSSYGVALALLGLAAAGVALRLLPVLGVLFAAGVAGALWHSLVVARQTESDQQ